MATLKEKTAKGLFWGVLNSGTMQVLNLVFGIFFGRLLSPADYGIVGMIAIFTALASNLQDSGFSAALVNRKNLRHDDCNAVWWFSMTVSILAYVILFFSAPLIATYFRQPVLTPLSRFVFLALPLSAASIAHGALLTRRLAVKEKTVVSCTALLVSGIVGICLAWKGYAYWSLAWQQVIYNLVTLLGRCLYIRWRPTLPVRLSPIREMFPFSCKLLVTNILTTLNGQLLTVVFGRLFTPHAVGNYTQAGKWNNMASGLVTGTVAQVALPVLSQLSDNDERQVRAFRKMLRFTAFLAFPAMFGLAIVAHEFIVIALTEKWQESVPLLQILCVGGAFLPFYNLYQNLFLSRGQSDIYMWCNLAQLAVQLLLVICCARYGVTVMVAAFAAMTVLFLLPWQFLARRSIRLRFRNVAKDTLPFLLTALLTMAVTYILTRGISNLCLSLLAKVIVAAVIYTATLYLLGAHILKECFQYLFRRK